MLWQVMGEKGYLGGILGMFVLNKQVEVLRCGDTGSSHDGVLNNGGGAYLRLCKSFLQLILIVIPLLGGIILLMLV